MSAQAELELLNTQRQQNEAELREKTAKAAESQALVDKLGAQIHWERANEQLRLLKAQENPTMITAEAIAEKNSEI